MRKKITSVLMLFAALLTAQVGYASSQGAGGVDGAQTPGKVTADYNGLIFEATFRSNDCGFKEDEGAVTAWTHDPDGFMKADGYGKVKTMTAFCLNSPVIKLSPRGNVVSFSELGNYFSNRWNEEAQLVIRDKDDAEWTVLDRDYIVGDQGSAVSTGDIVVPSKFNGRDVVFAFRYSSDGHHKSGTWYVRDFKVTAVEGAKADAGLSFEKDIVEFVFGSNKPFQAPALINPNNLPVTYSSDNSDVAVVDAATGSVAVVAEGTAVITAQSAETDDFLPGKASYTINSINTSEAEYAQPALRSPMVAVEFTGQRCRYCPNTSRDLHEKQIKYGKENFIIAALHHLESFSKLPPSQVSLYNEEAMQYALSLEVHDGLPQMAYNSLGPLRSDLTLEEEFQLDDLLEFTGQVTYTGNREYNIEINTRLRKNQTEVLKGKKVDIILWSLENGVMAFQDDNGVFVTMEHNHIFRGSVNSTWGEPYEVGSVYSKTWKIPEQVDVPKNTEIVAMFIDHDNRLILDAGCMAVTSDETGIEDVNVSDGVADAPVYNLMGIRVNGLVKGEIYIQNGKKFIAM